MPPELRAFDHVHVFVADRARAEAWYGEVLGLRRDGNPYEITTCEVDRPEGRDATRA